MPRILKIDNFIKDFPVSYGLESDGTCYEVTNPFYIEIIEEYKKEGEIQEQPRFAPVWVKISTKEGDLISITESGSFIKLKGFDGFVACRPFNPRPEGEPSFNKFPDGMVEKIGKGLITGNTLSMEDRKNIIIERGL